jgi:hypothetical protein
MADPRVHDTDPGVHDAPIYVFTMPIPVFTMDRSWRSRCADLAVHDRPKPAHLGLDGAARGLAALGVA